MTSSHTWSRCCCTRNRSRSSASTQVKRPSRGSSRTRCHGCVCPRSSALEGLACFSQPFSGRHDRGTRHLHQDDRAPDSCLKRGYHWPTNIFRSHLRSLTRSLRCNPHGRIIATYAAYSRKLHRTHPSSFYSASKRHRTASSRRSQNGCGHPRYCKVSGGGWAHRRRTSPAPHANGS